MTAPDSLPLHALAEDNLAAASPDLLRAMVKTFADALMSAEADALCNAEYRQVSDEHVNHRNGYRPREARAHCGPSRLQQSVLLEVIRRFGGTSRAGFEVGAHPYQVDHR
ncbi:mutator family transposase [Streptomyces sp. Ag109_O5-1]|uniref:transposase n=1 Tax=Streptomyces sp. Ag109_O5-1 TaxID=1938851 RepID=UPI000FA8B9B2|nr:transposase [Streptomyces sp. Ag109_O5-1]RPE43127.1 mutator family transposase [Streptomyces sp. Ag109_O5-1]